MIYRRKTYKILPEMLEPFNLFFHTYLYPNQRQHGAKLIGRWTNDTHTEIVAIWSYTSKEHYESIETSIRASDLHKQAQKKRQELGPLFLESTQEFLTSTAPSSYHPPKQIVSVAGLITNDANETLLVRNLHRSDTMEIPGGQVEEGETLEEAIHREILEETGVAVSLRGITGIYQNVTSGVICVVFRGDYLSGTLQPDGQETAEVVFQELSKDNVDKWITREQLKNRTLDAFTENYLPYEANRVRPYELLTRFEATKEYN
ncbi:MutT/nudix family protein [Bacillus sp. JCM 19046]|nr:MutT/nudix family protein [Bacillus sp. JCM 19045]GAF19726.1 MutT/nudix family protein [Bacillus sp. JCM 19046]